MTTYYNQEFHSVSRPSSTQLLTLLKAGKIAALFTTTFAYYSLRAGIIVNVEPVEGKESGLKTARRIISSLLSSPIVASVSAGGFMGSAVGVALAAGLFLVAILLGATVSDFASLMPLPSYWFAVSLFVLGSLFSGGLGGGLLGMTYSYYGSVSKVRNKLFGVTVFALLGGLIGEIAGIGLMIIYAVYQILDTLRFLLACC